MKSRHLFLSYRSNDADFALRLAADLKNAGVNLWMDRLDMRPGQDWLRTLQEAVDDSSAMLSILSPEYVESRYCQREMARADRMNRPIFPILLRSIDAKSWPFEIERQQYIDFSSWRSDEIYAVQLRELIDILTQDFGQSNLPSPEMRYLTSLVAELETRKGVLEYVELSAQADKRLSEGFVRPQPRYAEASDLPGAFTLLEETSSLSEKSVNVPLQRKIPLNNIGDALQKYPRFVLIGTPGAGKTTTLNHLVLDAVRAYQTTPNRAPLPVLLKLTNWKRGESFETFLRSSWPFESDAVITLAAGQAALYLDGLNEMGDEHSDKAQQLRHWLHGPHAPAYVVVTCRSAEYTDDLNLGLPTVEAAEMDKARIQEFVTKYVSEAVAAPLLERLLPQKAGDLQNSHHLYQLARNPFLLTVLILVYQSSPERALPHNMGALLKRLSAELWERERARRGENWIPLDKLERALSELAYRMIDADSPVYVASNVALTAMGSPDYLDAGHSANFLEIEGDNVRFSYQLIQEYFAALGVARAGLPTKLSRPVFNPSGERVPYKWDQVIVALSGIVADPDGIVRNIAEVDPFLAMECVASGINVDASARQEVADRLLGSARQPESEGKVEAARLLAAIDHPQALPFLLDVLRSGTWQQRIAAEPVIHDIEIEGVDGLTEALQALESYTRDTTAVALRQFGDRALPNLLQALKSGHWAVRRGAAWGLGLLKDAAAVPSLVEALRDEEAMVAAEAAVALGWIHDSAGIPWLLEALRHESWRVRKAAAGALGWIGPPSVPHLLRLQHSDREDLRRLAVEALTAIRDPQVPGALLEATYDPSPDVRALAVEALKNVEVDVAVNRLIELLADHAKPRAAKQRISEIAARILELFATPKALAAVAHWRSSDHSHVQSATPKKPKPADKGKKSGSTGHDRLKAISHHPGKAQTAKSSDLHSPNWVERRNAIQALANHDKEAALPALLNALSDEDNQVRIAAVRILRLFPDDAAIQGLLRALGDSDYLVCDAAGEELHKLGTRAVPGLIEVLQSSNLNLRGAALEILATVADESAVPALAECLKDTGKPWLEDQRICDLAAATLQRIGTPEAIQALRDWQPGVYGGAVEPLPFAVHAAPSIPSVDAPLVLPLPPLETVEEDETELAAPVYSGPTDPRVAELLDAVRHSEWGAREIAAKALREYSRTLKGKPETPAASMLVATLDDQDWILRWASVEALAWIGDQATVQPLIQRLDDENWMVRVAVIRALAEIGGKAAVPGIGEAMIDANDLVREAAAEALGVLGDPSAVPTLGLALTDPERFVRLAAVQALGLLGDRAIVPSLAQVLHDGDDQLRWAAAEALGKLGGEEAVALLIDLLSDDTGPQWEEKRVCDVAADALEKIGTPKAREALDQWHKSQAKVS